MGALEYRFTIKEMPADERPREKLIKFGAESQTDAELLAIIIRAGNKIRTADELSQDIINHYGGIKALNYLDVEEMKKVKGIGDAKAVQVKAAVELGRRLASLNQEKKNIV